MTHIDLALAREGYLRSPDGRVRHVPGLERIAADTIHEGARVFWGTLGDEAGCSFCWTRVILLAPWLFEGDAWLIRDVWSHELAHCVVGQSQERAREWQHDRYGDLLVPA